MRAPWLVSAACLMVGGLGAAPSGCKHGAAQPAPASASASARGPAPISTMAVEHGDLDTLAPDGSPRLAATVIAATVYKLPNTAARRLGYLRLGAIVKRDAEQAKGEGCKGPFYRVYPMGYVCSDEATTDIESPLVRAASRRPDLSKPLPYRYGFVRATAPQYVRIPTRAEQEKSEFKLVEHMQWFEEHKDEVQRVELGANDVALDGRGMPSPAAKSHASGYKPAPSQSRLELFGAPRADETPPFWLLGGRKVPNVSGFDVPEYAVFADRVRRKTGLSFVGAFDAEDAGFVRSFGITVDLRLIPLTKVKPDTGSPFHGVEIAAGIEMPFAFVIKRDVTTWKLLKGKDEAKAAEEVPRRAIVPLTGTARIKAGRRFYQTTKDRTRWLIADDIAVVAPPAVMPEVAQKGEKWVDVSLRQQTLILWEGKRPFYATLVSTGQDRLGDPKTSKATIQGSFRLMSKHIAAAMDSEENSAVLGGTRAHSSALAVTSDTQATIERLLGAEKSGTRLDDEDQRRLLNVKKGRHPEYGVTTRRGSQNFELRDVPWIQYFAAGYALHGAYWHDVFGIPRSHGCINLSPVDARVVFLWTDPPLPDGWHGINVGTDMGQGTFVYVHE